ncbi:MULTISPECIES: DUF5658 family protein [unclassified Halorhabdus]|uniref:DUF5658 family protein n=1 Tax=unclassified Halorhabdus TaxID=2621901 RepID=UPI0023DA691E|nr:MULTISPECIES: DUF5658 family protein [unclassified Halorhabdus]WEL18649.1 putative membrane protein [Halorhabdus sp. SVX81]WEL22660.1 putative membrane protein [Halorhabdus sp. BNX81]
MVELRTLPERVVPGWFQAGLAAFEAFLEPRPLPEADAVLWIVVLVGSAFDIVTTMVGTASGLSEGNAVARAFMATYGTPGIGALKLVALVCLVLAWHSLAETSARLVLWGFSMVSLVVVGLNTITLAGM